MCPYTWDGTVGHSIVFEWDEDYSDTFREQLWA